LNVSTANFIQQVTGMTRISSRFWTPEAIERFAELLSSNASPMQAAIALKRPVTAVKAQARKLGTPFPSTPKGSGSDRCEYRRGATDQSTRPLSFSAKSPTPIE
jgi:hypothetical protein